MQLDGKVALITGGGSGIGKAAAQLFAQQGVRVGVLGNVEAQVQGAVDEINAGGGQALGLTADVSQPEQMQQAVEQLAGVWGTIDIVFANAGINGVWAPLEELTPEEWDTTININLKGTFLTVKYALPYLKKQGGAVVITSSVNGTRIFGNSGASAYSTSKAGVAAFAKMIAVELARYKIRVNTVCPGWIKTNIGDNTERRNTESVRIPVHFPDGQIPLTGRQPATPEQVAQLVLFLSSDLANHITGTEVWIDGAQSLLQG